MSVRLEAVESCSLLQRHCQQPLGRGICQAEGCLSCLHNLDASPFKKVISDDRALPDTHWDQPVEVLAIVTQKGLNYYTTIVAKSSAAVPVLFLSLKVSRRDNLDLDYKVA